MAIKGKGRTRGHRPVAAPPRRALVVRKPPIWRRRWVWGLVGVIVLAAVLVGAGAAVHARSVSARKDRRHDSAQALLTQIRSKLPLDRTVVPPDLVVVFPSVSDDVQKIGTDLKGKALATRAKEVIDQANTAADGLRGIKLVQIIPDEFTTDRDEMSDARFLMAQAMQTYQEIGGLMEAAASLGEAGQKVLVVQMQTLITQAGAQFDQGYRKVVHLANLVKIDVNVPFSPPPAAPSPGPTAASPSG